MAASTIQVVIKTPHWLKRKVIYIPKEWANIFPTDALGARGEEEVNAGLHPKRGKPVILDYGIVVSECDIATDKDGKMRPRESGPIGEFFEAGAAKVGDYVTITSLGDRRFEIRLVKTDDAAV